MTDHPSKITNVQLPTQQSDGLPSGIVEPDSPNGGAIDGGTVAGAAEQNVEGCACDTEYPFFGIPGIWHGCMGLAGIQNVYSRLTQRHLS